MLNKKAFVLCIILQAPLCASDVPIFGPNDTETIAQNVTEIGHNLCSVAKNNARIGVRASVQISSGAAQFTKFCAEHPIFAIFTGTAAYYAYRKWHQVCDCTRKRCGADFTLVDVWRTTREHWQRRPAH